MKYNIEFSTISAIEEMEDYNDEYVYDIGVNSTDPWFFGNDIMVHNSVYFSAYNYLKDDIDAGRIPWDRDDVIAYYDAVCDEVNLSFPKFMNQAFHCPKTRSGVIKAGREIVGSNALFITKKRYAVLYYDKEGKRADVNGKPGKIKAMGLDLKRSDTPEVIQQFLAKVLEMVLSDEPKDDILKYIVEFRTEFKKRPPWEKGRPMRANKISQYRAKENKAIKVSMPGQVRASLNWNKLRFVYNDRHSMQVVDGSKVIVCTLKPNPLGFKSVAYPVDELRLPQWFKELPFDVEPMEKKLIDEKLSNLIGVLKWDLSSTQTNTSFSSFFTAV